MLTAKEEGNRLRWDFQKRGFYEVYFLKWNDVASQTAAWIRYTLTSPLPEVGEPFCELWGIFFDNLEPQHNFAVKQSFQISALHTQRQPFKLQIEDAWLDMRTCKGKISAPGCNQVLAWDVELDSRSSFFPLFPHDWFYRAPFPKTKVVSPHHDGRFSGKLIANGREIDFSNAPGQQTHLWGTKHALRWVWGHCNAFQEDPTAVWEGLDAQVALGPIPSPHFKLFYLKMNGREYWFNSPLHWMLNTSSWNLGLWNFETSNEQVRLQGEVRSSNQDLVGVTYRDPDGEYLWCNNSKISRVRLQVRDTKDRVLGELTSDAGCAAEYVDRKTYPQVAIRI